LNEVVAICKTFCGHEFLPAMIQSVYDHVDYFLFVHSEISWSGDEGNTVREHVQHWKENHDSANKIVQIEFNSTDQNEQYARAFRYVKKNIPEAHGLIIDTDEVYEKKDIVSLIRQGQMLKNDAFTCRMHTYIKTPFFRVHPYEQCKPVVYVRNFDVWGGIRGNMIADRRLLPNVFFHHFTLVRETEDDSLRKLDLSHKGDNAASNDLKNWKKSVWDRIPNVKNFHPTKGSESCWKSIKRVSMSALPDSVKNLPIIKTWR